MASIRTSGEMISGAAQDARTMVSEWLTARQVEAHMVFAIER